MSSRKPITSNKDKNKYYVYALLSPLVKKECEYLGMKFEYEPFYIGSGIGHRVLSHYTTQDDSKKSKYISKLLENECKPLYKIFYISDSKSDVLEVEKAFITKIGLVKDKTGPLLNVASYQGNIISDEKFNLIKYGDYNLEDMKDKIESKKVTFEISDKLYEQIMDYGYENKIFKFGPALVDIINKHFDKK
jgi:hypothetical protein